MREYGFVHMGYIIFCFGFARLLMNLKFAMMCLIHFVISIIFTATGTINCDICLGAQASKDANWEDVYLGCECWYME